VTVSNDDAESKAGTHLLRIGLISSTSSASSHKRRFRFPAYTEAVFYPVVSGGMDKGGHRFPGTVCTFCELNIGTVIFVKSKLQQSIVW